MTPEIRHLYFLVLSMVACNPLTEPPASHLSPSSSIGPISSSLGIVDVGFLNANGEPHPQGNTYASGSQGSLRLKLQDRRVSRVPALQLDVTWTVQAAGSASGYIAREAILRAMGSSQIELEFPFDSALLPGTYLVVIQLREARLGESLKYEHELIIASEN